jgi:2-polyprenyl-6-methoxyphenol hydroxylase-like FAD-dependent oxidoreductase
MATGAEIVIAGAGVAGASMAIVLARRGHSVLLLEKSKAHLDRVRGESITPWGVEEARQIDVLDILLDAGGHFASELVIYGEGIDPAAAEARAIDLSALVPDVGGNLKIGHPGMCDALDAAAVAAGAELMRGVSRVSVTPGTPPLVSFIHDGKTTEARPRLVIGADGRSSAIAKQIGARVETDPMHHIFGGLLIDEADDWPDKRMAIGTEGAGTYYIFPQGHGRIRLYCAYDVERSREFAGPDGARRFLDAFRVSSIRNSDAVANARPAGPCHGFSNADTWVDRPMAPGVVLIGDAAGHNDPTIGQGISIAFRDVRLVSEALAENERWTESIFLTYAEERRERMRKLRVTAQQFSKYRCEYTDEARAGRQRARDRLAEDPGLGIPFLVPLKGPDGLPDEAYGPAVWRRLFA